MTKDYQRLTIVSKLFTEETLKDVLINETGGKNVSVTGWSFGDASAKGDSYLSTVDRIIIEGISDEKPITVKVVVKSLPRNLGRRKTYRSTDFFYNEIIFYSKVCKFNYERNIYVYQCSFYLMIKILMHFIV